MADEPKPDTTKPETGAAAQTPAAASTSPTPADAAGSPTGGSPDPAKAADASQAPAPEGSTAGDRLQPDALSDGTVPTVLKPGETHLHVPKSKGGLNTLYRRADIMTTLFTFLGLIVAGAAVLGVYVYFTKSKSAAPPPTKVTQLNKSDLDKLDTFFNGNSAGKPSEVLTVSSASLFQGRVAMSSDLKVVGALQVSAGTSLADLTVDKTSTLGVTNVRGQLTVNGPLTVQNPALFNAGGSFKGNVAASGNGSFGGSLSAATINTQDLSVGGSLNINGHLNIGGLTPSAAPDIAAGSGATASVAGNDAAGTVTVTTGNPPSNANAGGQLVKISFHNSYPSAPTIIISPDSRSSALLEPFVIKSADWFYIVTSFDAQAHATYSFDYWVVR